jgi:hypothetical protein
MELAAQKMRGWEKDGEPYRHLLNHDCAIPAEAAREYGGLPPRIFNPRCIRRSSALFACT